MLPTRISGTAPRSPAAHVEGRAAFVYPYSAGWIAMAHPDMWEIVRGAEGDWHILPDLKRLMLIPGLNGMRTTRGADGRKVADPRFLITEMVSRGYVEVPSVDVVAGDMRQPHYCVRYPTKDGVTHLWAWELPEVTHSQRSRTVTDRAAQVAFLRWVASDLLKMEGPPEDILEGMRNELRTNASKYAIEARTRPTRASAAEHLAAVCIGLGWADGLDLSRPPARRMVAPGAVPVVNDDTAAELATLRAAQAELMAELAALRAATASPSASPPAAGGGLVGSPDLGGEAVPQPPPTSARPASPKPDPV